VNDGKVGKKGAVSPRVLMVLLHHIWMDRERGRGGGMKISINLLIISISYETN
jgi:hypothetical protein